MGRVYLARSAGGRTVAVKVVHPELAAQDEFRRRFAREVAAIRRVGGVGTAPVLGSDTEADAPWVAIGYVAGPSLRAVVGAEYGPLPPASVRALAVGLAGALEHIHAAGLVHRDLKPANILLTVDGPRIIDFGIARAVDTVTDGGLTSTGAVVGSPGFMSPEQVRGERLTPASDIFCLGSVLAYAATGRSPFGTVDSGVHAMMFRIAHDEPDLEGLPPELGDLVRACLAKDPAERPSATQLAAGTQDAADPWLPAELLAQLGRHAARLLDADGDPTPVDHPPRVPADAVTRRPPVRRRRRRILLAACTAVALALGGTALAVTYWPDARTSTGKSGDGTGPTATTASDRSDTADAVPAAFVGAWEGVIRGSQEFPDETTRIEIGKGGPGDQVGVYTHVTGELLCMGRSRLVGNGENEIMLGESEVTVSVPDKRCTAAAHQTLTLRSAQVLEWRSGTVTATLRKAKSGAEVIPAKMVGTWRMVPHPEESAEERDLYLNEVTVTQGPVGAPLVRLMDQSPIFDDKTGLPTTDTMACYGTALVAGAGNLVVLGPPQLDESDSHKDCEPTDYPQTLRLARIDGKDRLLVTVMGFDSEPAEYARHLS